MSQIIASSWLVCALVLHCKQLFKIEGKKCLWICRFPSNSSLTFINVFNLFYYVINFISIFLRTKNPNAVIPSIRFTEIVHCLLVPRVFRNATHNEIHLQDVCRVCLALRCCLRIALMGPCVPVHTQYTVFGQSECRYKRNTQLHVNACDKDGPIGLNGERGWENEFFCLLCCQV